MKSVIKHFSKWCGLQLSHCICILGVSKNVSPPGNGNDSFSKNKTNYFQDSVTTLLLRPENNIGTFRLNILQRMFTRVMVYIFETPCTAYCMNSSRNSASQTSGQGVKPTISRKQTHILFWFSQSFRHIKKYSLVRFMKLVFDLSSLSLKVFHNLRK